MKNTVYILAISALALALIIPAGAILFNDGLHQPDNPGPGDGTGLPTQGSCTGLQALGIADRCEAVNAWKVINPDAVAAKVSTESAEGGESGYWSIVYSCTPSVLTVIVSDAKVVETVESPKSVSQSAVSLKTGLIDSDRAWQVALSEMSKAGRSPEGQASISLSPRSGQLYTWDIGCNSGGGFYVIRIDATTGAVVASQIYGGG